MKLSIIIPVYNEKGTILQILEKIMKLPLDKEILIVDDFSTDGTRDVLRNYPQDKNIRIIFHEENSGKGSAIRTALSYVTGEVVVIQDADLEYDPADFLNLLKPILEEKAKVVYGSRLLNFDNERSYFRYFMGGKILTLLTNLLYGSKITDEPTCYKMFKTEVIKSLNLNCKRFDFCPEVTAKIRKKGIEIMEVPIRYIPRKIKQGKKIRWKDGVEAIWTLLKYRFRD
ncbi:MAG: glycosyltransferase family 2 protein [candidate division Zixibacteria bacterium]|nr:glycosyltransferase family 2 protein [candidate division Zixibacteria bacterium]